MLSNTSGECEYDNTRRVAAAHRAFASSLKSPVLSVINTSGRYGTVKKYGTVRYNTVHQQIRYAVVRYCTVRHSTLQYSTVQYCRGMVIQVEIFTIGI